jgi:AraC family ethanolamine operon transcriptional activator
MMFTTTHRVTTNVEELSDPLLCARTSPMILHPGSIRAEWNRADLGGVLVELCDYSFSVATRGETAADRVALLAPTRAMVGHLNGEALTPGIMHVWGESAEIAGTIEGPAGTGIMSLPRQTLVSTANKLGLEVAIPSPGEFCTVDGQDRHLVQHAFDTIRRVARGDGNTGPSEPEAVAMRNMLVETCVRSLSAENNEHRAHTPNVRLRSVAIVRACEEYAADVRYQGVTMADLCRVVDKSERRVRTAFGDCYGMSPVAYLRIAALHEVRRTLLNDPVTRDLVSRTACDFGFWHLGRFAGQYRALFGELPGTTIEHRRHDARATPSVAAAS